MRIALTITELDAGGGAEKCLVRLACWLKRQGHFVTVFAIGPPPPRDQNVTVSMLDRAAVPVHFGGFSGASQAPSAVLWLRKALRECKPDVVQSMLFHANVLTALCLPKHAIWFGGARVRQPQRVRGILQRLASWRMRKLVCVSQDVALHSSKTEGIPREKTVVIPNGIDLNTCVPREWNEFDLPPDSRVILSVGRLADQKGYRELLSYADTILQDNPQHHIVIMGQGPQLAELQSLQERSQSQGRVHLLGWQTNIESWMAACEIFVLPTHYEGMPNAILEAMAAGKPVVVNDVDGVREVVGTSPPADRQIADKLAVDGGADLASRVSLLIASEEMRAELGQANRQRIVTHFAAEEQFRKYLDLYEAEMGP